MSLRALAGVLSALAVGGCALVQSPLADSGPPSSPIDATLTAEPSKPSFHAGEPVIVRVRLTNEGDTPLSCLTPCGELASVATFTDAAGAAREIRPSAAAEAPHDDAYWRPLGPAERADREIDLGGLYPVTEPGRYSFRVIARGREGWIDRLHPRVADMKASFEFTVVASTGP
jgi:hypothetical protein